AVRRVSGNAQPNFRIDCTVAVGELAYFNEPSSLGDLAVTDDSLAVGALAYPYATVTDTSSWGPTANPNGPMKPDVAAPGEVTNFAAFDANFNFSGTFNGTSAAAAHVAGMVALLQGVQLQKSLPPYSVDQIKQILFGSAIDYDDGDPSLTGPD